MVHLPVLIKDLALILGAAAVITLLFKKLKQPVVLGYIIAGLLVGPNFKLFPTIVEIESIRTWAEIGVIFLLFSLGLEFSFKKLMRVGGAASITALVEITFITIAGYLTGKWMGWSTMDSLFLGGMLASSSTTIIIRAFDELGVKTKQYVRIVFGVLVVEDIVVILLMVLLSTIAVTQQFGGGEILFTILKLVFFLALWFLAGIFLLPTILKKSRSLLGEETLLILSLSLCLGMVVLATKAGFSAELGAFIMGSILAETTSAEKVEHVTKPVKDFFGAVFFVSVGMMIDPGTIVEYGWPVLAVTLLTLFGKLFSTTLGALISGQPLKQSVQVGMSMAQIGEFAFIVATLGLSLGVISDFLFPVAVGASVITTFSTPYMIRYSDLVYMKLDALLPQSWKNALNKYSIGAQTIEDASDWKKLIRFYFINTIVFSVVIITLIILCTEYLSPMFAGNQWGQAITAGTTLILLSPFLYALAFRRTQKEAYANIWMKPFQRGPLIILLLTRIALAIFYVGFLFHRLFSPGVAVIGVCVATLLLFIFWKRIKLFYSKIELRFLSNLNEREEQQQSLEAVPLAPWDAHISTIQLNPESKYAGQTLQESKIREEFGVNIAMIERGSITIRVPGRDERLFPGDTLSVIGTDEQLNTFKDYLESTVSDMELIAVKQSVSLQHFTIGKNSGLLKKSIRESGIRELTKGLVVGVERKGERILNPESDLVFEVNDIVWVVGNEKRIQVLSKESQTE